MSSHHFVKEGQEPALLIVEPLSFELIGPLLEWAPYVIVAGTIIEDILRWGVKIDAVVAKDDERDFLLKKLSTHGPVAMINCRATESSLQAGIDFLISKKQRAVNIVMDAPEKVLDELLRLDLDILIVLITHHMKWSIISSEFKKWLPEQTYIQVRPSKTKSVIYTSSRINDPGVFTTEKAGTVTLHSEKSFWVGELLT